MKRILFVVVLAALLVATTGAASAGTTRIYFTGKTACDDPDWSQVREWMAGPNYQGRVVTSACYDDSASTPQLLGIEYIRFKVQMVGGKVGKNFILSGTDRMETYEGGVWVGSWVMPSDTMMIKIIMHGEGMYAGQQLHMWEDANTDEFWGYITVPGG